MDIPSGPRLEYLLMEVIIVIIIFIIITRIRNHNSFCGPRPGCFVYSVRHTKSVDIFVIDLGKISFNNPASRRHEECINEMAANSYVCIEDPADD